MVRLNKNLLEQKQLEALYTQLNQTLGKLEKNQTNQFLSELLGYEERVMLAKRLAIIVLLLEEKTLYFISVHLKVSTATAEKVKSKLENDQYTHIVRILSKDKKNYFAILETLDDVLHLGGILPHYNGPDRWKHLR